MTAHELRVGGRVGGHWTTALEGLELRHHPDGTSTLTGGLANQAQLHGILAVLRDIGATLVSL